MNTEMKKTNELVLTAMFMCMIILAQIVIRLPIPGTGGYVHLADAVVYLSVIYLGHKNGALAAGLGSAMGDVIGGFAVWAPWTFVIKGGMALIFGLLAERTAARADGKLAAYAKLPAMVIAGLFMVVAYFGAETIMYGNPGSAVLGVPWNIAQFVVGIVVADAMQHALKRAHR
ncbi:MAG: ECF transporter S component [Firmicutes bacterium]|nr:ECF transporter S component [Bacillota bacterium]